MLEAIQMILEPVKARVGLMVGRCVLRAVTDATKLQRVQVQVLADEVHDDVERVQSYGLTSVPHAGAEGVVVFAGGNRDHGLVIAVDDRRYRLVGLEAGEVALYDDQGLKVHLTRDGIVVDGAGKDIHFVNAPTVHIPQDLHVARDIIADRDIYDQAAGAPKSMKGMRTAHNGHRHVENNVAGGPTNTPDTGM
ncbi:phage baseplate assembly protein V [Cupriavidus taiwanensis]|uniref:phage baseplate assembly protein V n=1 Tax=Cupriavidus taiwanensis TaxID=164546 RepID=UPI0039C24D48